MFGNLSSEAMVAVTNMMNYNELDTRTICERDYVTQLSGADISADYLRPHSFWGSPDIQPS